MSSSRLRKRTANQQTGTRETGTSSFPAQSLRMRRMPAGYRIDSYTDITLQKRMAERKIKLLQQENELNAARRYIEGLEEECKYFAKELHDGIANDLLGLQMKIENTTDSDNIQELGTLIKEVRNNVRNISHELMPPEFEHLSLDEILYQYADKLSENTGIQVTYTSGSCNPIPNETAYELYRIVQEITMNIVKHANAHCISVSLYAEHEKQYTLK